MTRKQFTQLLGLKEAETLRIYGQSELDETTVPELFFYTGKGPSNDVTHLGHYLLYRKFAQLSRRYPVLIQIAADEKRNLKRDFIDIDKANEYCSNTKTMLKQYYDWNYENTYLVDNLDPKINYLLHNCANYICKHLKLKTVHGAFGNVNLYQAYYLALQIAPILLFQKIKPNSRCVLIIAEDQKACFLILRDLAQKLNVKKPIVVTIVSLLDNKLKDKMSSSSCNKAITITPSLNLKNLKTAVSAPFKDNAPDPQKDYVSYLMGYLILNGLCVAELEKIRANYRNKQTAVVKDQVSLILESFFKSKFEPKKDFCSLISDRLNHKSLLDIVKQFQICYVS